MDNRISLRLVSDAIGHDPGSTKRWLADLGGPRGQESGWFDLDYHLVAALVLCQRLSAAGLLSFNDFALVRLMKLVRSGKHAEDLRAATLAVSSFPTGKRFALAVPDDLALEHAANGEGMRWIGQMAAMHLVVEAPTTFISMQGVYEQADAIFAARVAEPSK